MSDGEPEARPESSPKLDERRDERLDELLDEAPETDHHLGRFAGYRSADKVRRRIAIVMVLAGLSAVVAYRQYVAWQEYERFHPFELTEEAKREGRPREMHWSGGRARLGLSREAPGVQVIHLPDRRIELAPGSERAQFNVETVEGRRRVVLLTGDIVQTGLDGEVIPNVRASDLKKREKPTSAPDAEQAP